MTDAEIVEARRQARARVFAALDALIALERADAAVAGMVEAMDLADCNQSAAAWHDQCEYRLTLMEIERDRLAQEIREGKA